MSRRPSWAQSPKIILFWIILLLRILFPGFEKSGAVSDFCSKTYYHKLLWTGYLAEVMLAWNRFLVPSQLICSGVHCNVKMRPACSCYTDITHTHIWLAPVTAEWDRCMGTGVSKSVEPALIHLLPRNCSGRRAFSSHTGTECILERTLPPPFFSNPPSQYPKRKIVLQPNISCYVGTYSTCIVWHV